MVRMYVTYCTHAYIYNNYSIGENKSYYSIYPATVRHAGHYYCQVKNYYGVENSTAAIVAVSSSPTANIPSSTAGFTYSQLPLKGLANTLSNNGSQMQDSVSADLGS